MAKRKRNAASKPPVLEATDNVQEPQNQDEGPPAKRLRSKHNASPFTAPSKALTGRTIPEEHDLSSHVGQTSVTLSSKAAIPTVYIKKLVINVPPGHQGPLKVEPNLPWKNLDSPLALNEVAMSDNRGERKAVPCQNASDTTSKASPTALSRSEDESRRGFLSLPVELRDIIYEESLCGSPSYVPPSHQEGRKWLYSKNKFIVMSDSRSSGGYWEPKWSVLGYETMKVWFSTIDTENTQMLRDLSLYLDDFSPSVRPYAPLEKRQYVRDPDVLSILEHLAGCKNLRKLKINFDGRRRLDGTGDERPFFRRLMKIKTDHLELKGRYSEDAVKVCPDLLEQCRDAMEREQSEDDDD